MLQLVRNTTLVVTPILFFYDRNLPIEYLFSADNRFFLFYWLFIPMLIWFLYEKKIHISISNRNDYEPNKNSEEQVIKNSNNDVQSENFGTKMENYAKRLDDSSDKIVSSAKIKMLNYYKNSPVYYWYQILLFSLLMSVPLTLLIVGIIDYLFQGSIKYNYEFIPIYLTCFLLISTIFHNHYQK